jgi:hypothetical protein
MANRTNLYEAAFEQFLRDRRVPYVAVDESKRSMLPDATLKSLDFMVAAPGGGTWLVDVKGRRFPSGEQKQYWRNWSTRDDLRSLAQWEELFGPRSQALFVFAYKVVGRRAPLPAKLLYPFRGVLMGFVGIRLCEYVPHARLISPKWQTVALSTRRFRQLAEPFEDFLHPDHVPGPHVASASLADIPPAPRLVFSSAPLMSTQTGGVCCEG